MGLSAGYLLVVFLVAFLPQYLGILYPVIFLLVATFLRRKRINLHKTVLVERMKNYDVLAIRYTSEEMVVFSIIVIVVALLYDRYTPYNGNFISVDHNWVLYWISVSFSVGTAIISLIMFLYSELLLYLYRGRKVHFY